MGSEMCIRDSTHTLPIELIQEILQRLPVKFLLQLRCVCKSWKSLISHPQFAKNHLHSSPTATRLIAGFTNPAREFILRAYPLSDVFNAVAVNATELRYPFNNRKCYDFIVGSCDGILCFAVDQRRALLWNPSIGKFKKLPPLDNERRNGSYTIHGFGYDRFADSYKVVAIFCYECDGRYETQVKVLMLGTDLWRRIQEFPFGVPFDESRKFVSGTVNWLASNDSNSLVIGVGYFLLDTRKKGRKGWTTQWCLSTVVVSVGKAKEGEKGKKEKGEKVMI